MFRHIVNNYGSWLLGGAGGIFGLISYFFASNKGELQFPEGSVGAQLAGKTLNFESDRDEIVWDAHTGLISFLAKNNGLHNELNGNSRSILELKDIDDSETARQREVLKSWCKSLLYQNYISEDQSAYTSAKNYCTKVSNNRIIKKLKTRERIFWELWSPLSENKKNALYNYLIKTEPTSARFKDFKVQSINDKERSEGLEELKKECNKILFEDFEHFGSNLYNDFLRYCTFPRTGWSINMNFVSNKTTNRDRQLEKDYTFKIDEWRNEHWDNDPEVTEFLEEFTDVVDNDEITELLEGIDIEELNKIDIEEKLRAKVAAKSENIKSKHSLKDNLSYLGLLSSKLAKISRK